MVKFKKNKEEQEPKVQPVLEDTALEETSADISSSPQMVQPPSELSAMYEQPQILNHLKDTEELLEYIVSRMNDLTSKHKFFEEQILALTEKTNTAITIENVEPKAFKRKIVLNRDASGKIVGADVIDSTD